jgi:surface carbohydrate biosynthesis protein (TIGR04326 family)
MYNEVGNIIIWDEEGSPSYEADLKILWCNFNGGDDPSVISISEIVEDDAAGLRSKYLSWLYELGTTEIRGKRIIDILEIRPGFSFWWMTLLAQRTNAFESRYILDVVKLIALEDLTNRFPVLKSIHLVSNNKKLIISLKEFSEVKGYKFRSTSPHRTGRGFSSKPFYRRLPYPLQAFFYLINYFSSFYTVRRTNPKVKNFSDQDQISVIDILVHLDKDSISGGNFKSNYWTAIVPVLESSGIKTNWIHSFYKHESVKTPGLARALLKKFNYHVGERQSHLLLEAGLSIRNTLNTVRDYIIIVIKASQFTGMRSQFRPQNSAFNFWIFFKEDWNNSFFGTEAMINCLRLNLFEDTFRNIPHQRTGIYIQENQPWEMSLIYSWKVAGHGKLIGVPHTTVRYWDLRYFLDKRSFLSYKNNFPIPDIVAVNGNVAYKTYIEGGYPPALISKVEALRYLHLLDVIEKPSLKFSNKDALSILVCGDILSATNEKMLDWLNSALPILPYNLIIKVKPHPARSIDPEKYPSLNLKIFNEPLHHLLSEVDVTFTSNITSAAVDAYFSGVPVVSMLDGDSFNISPLRGLNGVSFVTSSSELASALLNSRGKENLQTEPYFYLDRKLPLWRKLLYV